MLMPRKAPPVLRDYQVTGLTMLRNAMARLSLAKKPRRVIYVSPTGSGKTVSAADLMRNAVAKGSRTLFVAPRIDLIPQTCEKLEDFGVHDYGVIQADHPRWVPHARIQVASIDTLASRLDSADFCAAVGKFDLIVFDECHTNVGEQNHKVRGAWPNAAVVGLTATPQLGKGNSLGDIYQDIVIATTVPNLIRSKHLVPITGYVYDAPPRRKRTHVEFSESEQSQIVHDVIIGGSVIKDYQRDAAGTRAVVFCPTVADAQNILKQARDAGIPSDLVADRIPANPRDRKPIYNALRDGQIKMLVNVFIMTIGTDIPAIETIIDLQPTTSVAREVQKLGRGLRPWCFDCKKAPQPECHETHNVKRHCRVHDHAGNLVSLNLTRYGTDCEDGDVDWTHALDPNPPANDRREAPTKVCPGCKAIVSAMCRTCPHCQHELGGVGITRLVEDPSRTRKTLEELRAERDPKLPELTESQLRRVHSATREEKLGEYLRLMDIQLEKGLKEGWIKHSFREVFGHWPKFSDEEIAAGTPAAEAFIRIPGRRRT